MLDALHGVKLHAQCYIWSDAYLEGSFMLNAIQEGIFMLIAIHGLKLCTQCYT